MRVCNSCDGTGVVKNLHNWATGGKREQACWNCREVDVQQPDPSAAPVVNPYPHTELRKTWQPGQRWQARSFRNGQWGPWTDAVASEPFWFPHQEYRRHPDDLAPQPSPTPQADSQPAPVPRNIEREALEYIFGNMGTLDWQRVVDEKLPPPWPLENHAYRMGFLKDRSLENEWQPIMANQQGAPEALPDPSPDQLRAIARTARNSSGSASDDCGPLAYVLHGWRASAIAFRAQQAALVEAQQPAPSAAAVDEGFLRSVIMLCNNQGASPESIENFDSGDKWIADLWRQAEQLIATAPQADSQPAPDCDLSANTDEDLMVIAVVGLNSARFRINKGDCAGALEVVNKARDACIVAGERASARAARAARAPADSVTAPAGGVVGYGVSDPHEPDLGHWLSEEPGAAWCVSGPLVLTTPTPPAQAADSVLEDAARWQALPAFFEEYQIDAMKLYRDIDAYLAAARKQGVNHD